MVMRVSTGSRHTLRYASSLRASQRILRRRITLASSSSSGSTVNPDEIAHFSRLSAQWWDERGEFGMLHKMNPVRTQFVREKLVRHSFVQRVTPICDSRWCLVKVEMNYEDGHEDLNESTVLEGLKVLDVGCGGGLLSEVRPIRVVVFCHTLILESIEPRTAWSQHSRN